MCPPIKVPGTMVGSNSSTSAPDTSYMHLRIPRPLTTNNVTDMSLVISSLHPQNTRNGRNCLLRNPIDKNKAQNTPQKKQGAVANPPPHGSSDYARLADRSDPSDGLVCHSMSFLVYEATSHSTVKRHPRHGGLERSSRHWMTTGQHHLMLKVDQRDGLAFWHLLMFLF